MLSIFRFVGTLYLIGTVGIVLVLSIGYRFLEAMSIGNQQYKTLLEEFRLYLRMNVIRILFGWPWHLVVVPIFLIIRRKLTTPRS